MVGLGCEGTFGSTSATIALANAVRAKGLRGRRFSLKYQNYIAQLQELLKIDDPPRERCMVLLRADFLKPYREQDEEFYRLVANVTQHRLRQYCEQGRIMERLRDRQLPDAAIALQLHEMRRDWDRRHKEERDDPVD